MPLPIKSRSADKSVFSEKQFVDAAKNFFHADRGSEKTVTAQNAAGDHLAFRSQIAERKYRCVFEASVRVNLALERSPIVTCSIDENEVRLEPTRRFEGDPVVVFFPDQIFARPFQRSTNESGNARFVIDQENLLG